MNEEEEPILDKYDTSVMNLISEVFYDGYDRGIDELKQEIEKWIKNKRCLTIDEIMNFIDRKAFELKN